MEEVGMSCSIFKVSVFSPKGPELDVTEDTIVESANLQT
jgi:hypothetical protein